MKNLILDFFLLVLKNFSDFAPDIIDKKSEISKVFF